MNIYHKQPTCLPCNPHLRFYMLEFLDSLFVCFENKYFLLRVTSWSRRRYSGLRGGCIPCTFIGGACYCVMCSCS